VDSYDYDGLERNNGTKMVRGYTQRLRESYEDFTRYALNSVAVLTPHLLTLLLIRLHHPHDDKTYRSFRYAARCLWWNYLPVSLRQPFFIFDSPICVTGS